MNLQRTDERNNPSPPRVSGEWVPDWLTRQAATKPLHPALIHEDGTLSYADLYAQARRISLKMVLCGIQRGDRVAVLARHGLSYAKAVHAVIQAGAVLVPLNIRLTADELAWQLNNVSASLVISDIAHLSLAKEAATRAGDSPDGIAVWGFDEKGKSLVASSQGAQDPSASVSVGSESSLESDPLTPTQAVLRLSDVQAIVHTSGTTGHPKGVQITFGNHYWSATASALQLGLDANERWLVPMPLFHVGGLAVIMRSLIYGTTAVLHDTFDAKRVNAALAGDEITLVSVVPTMLSRMLADEGRPSPGKQLRSILLGGSGASESLLRRCQEEGLPVAQSYGLTEANSQVATLKPMDALRKLGSSGQPLFPTAIRVVTDQGEAFVGEAGEIWVHGPTVTPGYLNRPDANAETFIEGWLRTGDIGYLDEEGYLYVLDRRKDLIVSGGENIYPAEIEKVLEAHPDVVEAGVVPSRDETWGHVPAAFVVPRSGLVESQTLLADFARELEVFCRQRIAGFKVPKLWRVVSSLPRNASGKLLRRQLIEWLDEQ